jgi:CTP:molybdopterin cytidylyltransferase MocA
MTKGQGRRTPRAPRFYPAAFFATVRAMYDEDMDGFVAVVLAGGFSLRMGRNKLLMEVAGRPMIRHVVETVRSVIPDVVVATGHQSERVSEALDRLPVTFLATDPSLGPGRAIAAAVEAVRCRSGLLVCVGDQPRLTEREISAVLSAYLKTDRSRALVPIREGGRGYPMVLPPGFDATGIDLAAEDVAGADSARIAGFMTRNPVYQSSVDTPHDYRGLFSI